MMKKTIFAVLALAAAGSAFAQTEQTTQMVISQKQWNTATTNTKWRPTASGTTGLSVQE